MSSLSCITFDLNRLHCHRGCGIDASGILTIQVKQACAVTDLLVRDKCNLERPEHTEGYEGFYHPIAIEGSASEVKLS